MTIDTAMILAAGLGTRMRPLTNDKPKALVQVHGRCLIDHVLDRCVDAGVKRAVVNVHAFADMLEAHVKRRTDIEIVISDERAQLMETGGGIRQARPLLGDKPIIVSNIDSVWEEPHGSALKRLAEGFDPARMSARLSLAAMDQQLGYDGEGDFFMDEHGLLTHRGMMPHTPWAYMGAQVIDPRIVDEEPLEPFGFMRVWQRLMRASRLYGAPLGGFWMHVGDPAAKEAAEQRLAAAA
ncbi:nucleotidyltransferase family protein [Terricaulis sp.]|uniref:nucleotidyltransferase family protein n=1 Tax=Terricaulis sp. TaxID=2768686 RepID=UPI003782E512